MRRSHHCLAAGNSDSVVVVRSYSSAEIAAGYIVAEAAREKDK